MTSAEPGRHLYITYTGQDVLGFAKLMQRLGSQDGISLTWLTAAEPAPTPAQYLADLPWFDSLAIKMSPIDVEILAALAICGGQFGDIFEDAIADTIGNRLGPEYQRSIRALLGYNWIERQTSIPTSRRVTAKFFYRFTDKGKVITARVLGCDIRVLEVARSLDPNEATKQIRLSPLEQTVLLASHRYPDLSDDVLEHVTGGADVLRLVRLKLRACRLIDNGISAAGRALIRTQ